jgi:hypothetical protein
MGIDDIQDRIQDEINNTLSELYCDLENAEKNGDNAKYIKDDIEYLESIDTQKLDTIAHNVYTDDEWQSKLYESINYFIWH